MIALLSPTQALNKISRSVFLPETTHTDTPSNELLAQVARRAITFMSPCAAHELIHAVSLSFVGLSGDPNMLSERVAQIVEDLIVYGDMLEMRANGGDDRSQARSSVLRPAPPSFVKREDGSVAVIGIAGDEITPLTTEFDSRVAHDGALRIIRPIGDEDLESALIELGLFKLPEKTWLRIPPFETAANHVAVWQQTLAAQPRTTPIENLQILDTARSPLFYTDRWVSPRPSHSGMFVARRPQRYGASIWCLVELEAGRLVRFEDLSVAGDRLRPFDIAWRIQAALDAAVGNPQRFDISEQDRSTTLLRFYSPIPSWCERHLSIAGRREMASKCLFCFRIPNAQLGTETRFLTEVLWMTERT